MADRYYKDVLLYRQAQVQAQVVVWVGMLGISAWKLVTKFLICQAMEVEVSPRQTET